MINKIIRNYLAKQAAGRADDGIMITLKDPQKIQMLENIMADLLMRNGIDPRAITNEKQLINIINRIEAFEKKNLADNIRSGIRDTESAKIFEIATGKEIPKGSKIMGGQAVENQKRFFKGVEIKDPTFDENLPFDSDAEKLAEIKMSNEAYEQIPPGNRGGPDDIAAPVQSSEETIKNMIMAENKKNIAAMKKRKMLDDAIDNVSPSLTGDRKYDAEIVAADLAERMGLVYDDMPVKERLKLYDEAYTGLTKKKFDPPEEKADGGRIGLKVGTGFRFLQKIFGKEKFKEMATRDPEMYQGLLEVVDMYRKRDKEGLKMYLQKFLPHMDDAQIEDFIRGSDGTEGLIGELIRLGSGRDYAGKIEMMKKAENMRKLDDLEVTDDMIRKPNADGGRIGYKSGTGIEAAIAENKKLQSGIDAELEMQKQIAKFLENRMIRSSPFGILMDQEPPEIYGPGDLPPATLDKSGKDVKIQKLPFKPEQSNIVIFDDGTVYYKDTGEFYNDDLGQVTSPSPGAKPVRETKEAKDGGIMRLGFKGGMNRRTFLKIFSGLVSLPIIGKVLKPLKVGKKVTQVPIIKTGDVPGKPEWFDQLVNKVILEGDDVTKRFATQEREVVHMKKIDDETSVTVTQDLNDGSIMVDVDDPIRNVMGESGDDTRVMMRLKKNPGDESNPAGPDEFDFTEADMRNYMDGPDDYTTEFTENTVKKMKDLTSDLGKIESYATGKKQTMKQFIESKKRQDKVRFAEEKPAEYAAERGPDIDFSDYDEMASGGIARMLGE